MASSTAIGIPAEHTIMFSEWERAYSALKHAEMLYNIVIKRADSTLDERQTASARHSEAEAKFEAIHSKLSAPGVSLEPILHNLQIQRQQAYQAIEHAKHYWETVAKRTDTTIAQLESASENQQKAEAKLETIDAKIQVIGGSLAPLTEIGFGSPRTVEEEMFESLWMKLSPHASTDAQEWAARVFRKERDLNLCDSSVIHDNLESTFAVRAEYHELDAYLTKALDPDNKDALTDQRKTFAIITGQPGIGKSIFMLWLLCKRIAAGMPTTWQTHRTLYLFGYQECLDGPRQFLAIPVKHGGRYHRFLSMPETWNLVDAKPVITRSDMLYNSPRADLVANPSSTPGANVHWPIIIFCSSHQQRRFKQWTKDRGGVVYYMEPWDLQEVLDFKDIGLFPNIPEAELRRRFAEVDGCIRQLVSQETVWELYHTQLVKSLAEFSKPDAILKAITDQNNRDDLSASNIFYVLPSPHSRADFQIRPGSKYILEMLMKHLESLRGADRWKFWDLSYSSPISRTFAGNIHEAYIHANLRELTLTSHGTRRNSPALTLPTKQARTSSFDGNPSSLAETTTWYIRPESPNFPTVDAVLLTNKKQVFLLQITLATTHSVKEAGLKKLQSLLPEWTQDEKVPWFFCFIGAEKEMVKEVCSKADIKAGNQTNKWRKKLEFRWIHAPYGSDSRLAPVLAGEGVDQEPPKKKRRSARR